MNLSRIQTRLLLVFLTLGFLVSSSPAAYSFDEMLIKNRKPYGKSIRTRMPPQVLIEAIQKDLDNRSLEWFTFWKIFVVEDDRDKDEFVIIARSSEKQWALGVLKDDCPKPENFEDLKKQVNEGGTPVRIDLLVGVKKNRSFFRYVINFYEPMYQFWTNPCYVWNLPPGTAKDKFYNENYTMGVYANNLRKMAYDLLSHYSEWKPPKYVKRIPVIKGPGQELIGGEAEEFLTDEERKLPLWEQERILEKRKAERDKARAREERKRAKEEKKKNKGK